MPDETKPFRFVPPDGRAIPGFCWACGVPDTTLPTLTTQFDETGKIVRIIDSWPESAANHVVCSKEIVEQFVRLFNENIRLSDENTALRLQIENLNAG